MTTLEIWTIAIAAFGAATGLLALFLNVCLWASAYRERLRLQPQMSDPATGFPITLDVFVSNIGRIPVFIHSVILAWRDRNIPSTGKSIVLDNVDRSKYATPLQPGQAMIFYLNTKELARVLKIYTEAEGMTEREAKGKMFIVVQTQRRKDFKIPRRKVRPFLDQLVKP